jgi:hypothetical protein
MINSTTRYAQLPPLGASRLGAGSRSIVGFDGDQGLGGSQDVLGEDTIDLSGRTARSFPVALWVAG